MIKMQGLKAKERKHILEITQVKWAFVTSSCTYQIIMPLTDLVVIVSPSQDRNANKSSALLSYVLLNRKSVEILVEFLKLLPILPKRTILPFRNSQNACCGS